MWRVLMPRCSFLLLAASAFVAACLVAMNWRVSEEAKALDLMIEEQNAEIGRLRDELDGLKSLRRRTRVPKQQQQAATLDVMVPSPPAAAPILIGHLINPMPLRHGLHADQEITFASLEAAASAARADGLRVELMTAELRGERRAPRPSRFRSTRNLTRHAHAVYEMERRGVGTRTLPLLGDLLSAGFDETSADIMIYTNADIGVQLDFYKTIANYAKRYEGFVINRVEVPERKGNGQLFTKLDLDELYALGKSRPQRHAGYDCFVWRRGATPYLRLFTRGVFVGYPPVGRVLKDALKCVSTTFAEIKGRKHTFHVGDRNGGWSTFPQYEHYNRKASKRAQSDFAKIVSTTPASSSSLVAACKTAKNRDNSTSRIVDAELEARSFLRWDKPGEDWPPQPDDG